MNFLDQIGSYAWVAFGVFLGTLARVGTWWDDKTFLWRKALSELLTVPCLGFIAGGAVQYFNPDAAYPIVGMIGAVVGFLGVATLQPILARWFEKKLG